MGLLNQTQQEYYNDNNYGDYQFVSLNDIINQFMVVYVGEDKIIQRARRVDVAFHAQRALAELSFDTFKSHKAQEIEVPATLQMILPQDYVNYTKISWVDSSGIKHPLYPTKHTSNPSSKPLQSSDGDFSFNAIVDLTNGSTNVVMDGLFYTPYGTDVSGVQIDGVSGGPWQVSGFSHSSNTTLLTLKNITSGVVFVSDVTAKEKLIFHTSDGSLYPNYENGAEVTNVNAWTIGEATLTVSSTSDLNGLKVGMIIEPGDGVNWSQGTKVLAVSGTSILLSKPAIVTNAAVATTIYFTSLEAPGFIDGVSTTWANYKSITPSENNNDDYEDDTYWPYDGERYGLEPSHAQANGSFYIDDTIGKIHFSSNISGKTVILDYISDSLGTDEEMQVHKFAEEAIYKWINYGIISGRMNIPENIVRRFKKEKFAETRKAKLRLSNIKLEEITQILRGKSKQIKH